MATQKIKSLIKGSLSTEISRRFELKDFQEAVNYYKQNMSKGKVVYRPWKLDQAENGGDKKAVTEEKKKETAPEKKQEAVHEERQEVVEEKKPEAVEERKEVSEENNQE